MTKYKEAVEAAARAMDQVQQTGWHGTDIPAFATAAVEAVLSVLEEPDEAVIAAGIKAFPMADADRITQFLKALLTATKGAKP